MERARKSSLMTPGGSTTGHPRHEECSNKWKQNVHANAGVLLPGIGTGVYWGPSAIFVFHLADSVPFQRHILGTLEHGSENDMTNDYASVAYWYALAGARDMFVMAPARERTVRPPDQWDEVKKREFDRYISELRRQLIGFVVEIPQQPSNEFPVSSSREASAAGVQVR